MTRTDLESKSRADLIALVLAAEQGRTADAALARELARQLRDTDALHRAAEGNAADLLLHLADIARILKLDIPRDCTRGLPPCERRGHYGDLVVAKIKEKFDA